MKKCVITFLWGLSFAHCSNAVRFDVLKQLKTVANSGGFAKARWFDDGGNLGLITGGDACYKPSYGRGVGWTPPKCAHGRVGIGLFCYSKCPEGYSRFGFDCHQKCPDATAWADQGLFCRKTEYWRNTVGTVASAPNGGCPQNKYSHLGLCYPRCRSGYSRQLDRCWKNCNGFGRDDGHFCAKPAPYGRGAGHGQVGGCGWRGCHNPKCAHGQEGWGFLCYPKCRQGYWAFGCCICTPTCPSGFTDIGVSCFKPSYATGVGTIPSTCAPGYENYWGLCYPKCKSGYYAFGCCVCRPHLDCSKEGYNGGFDLSCAKHIRIGDPGIGICEKDSEEVDAGLCYPKCRRGFHGVGPVCWGNTPTFKLGGAWTNCGVISTSSGSECGSAVADMILGPLETIFATVSFGGFGAVAKAAKTATKTAYTSIKSGAKAALKMSAKEAAKAAAKGAVKGVVKVGTTAVKMAVTQVVDTIKGVKDLTKLTVKGVAKSAGLIGRGIVGGWKLAKAGVKSSVKGFRVMKRMHGKLILHLTKQDRFMDSFKLFVKSRNTNVDNAVKTLQSAGKGDDISVDFIKYMEKRNMIVVSNAPDLQNAGTSFKLIENGEEVADLSDAFKDYFKSKGQIVDMDAEDASKIVDAAEDPPSAIQQWLDKIAENHRYAKQPEWKNFKDKVASTVASVRASLKTDLKEIRDAWKSAFSGTKHKSLKDRVSNAFGWLKHYDDAIGLTNPQIFSKFDNIKKSIIVKVEKVEASADIKKIKKQLDLDTTDILPLLTPDDVINEATTMAKEAMALLDALNDLDLDDQLEAMKDIREAIKANKKIADKIPNKAIKTSSTSNVRATVSSAKNKLVNGLSAVFESNAYEVYDDAFHAKAVLEDIGDLPTDNEADAASTALEIASLVDPTGLSSIGAAYSKPYCDTIIPRIFKRSACPKTHPFAYTTAKTAYDRCCSLNPGMHLYDTRDANGYFQKLNKASVDAGKGKLDKSHFHGLFSCPGGFSVECPGSDCDDNFEVSVNGKAFEEDGEKTMLHWVALVMDTEAKTQSGTYLGCFAGNKNGLKEITVNGPVTAQKCSEECKKEGKQYYGLIRPSAPSLLSEYQHAAVNSDAILPDTKLVKTKKQCKERKRVYTGYKDALTGLKHCPIEAAKNKFCGDTFMLSKKYLSWGCYCCAPDSKLEDHSLWDIYAISPNTKLVKTKKQCKERKRVYTGYKDALTGLKHCPIEAAKNKFCGDTFMLSKKYLSWGCYCCAPDSKLEDHNLWDIYAILSPTPAPTPAPTMGAKCGCNSELKLGNPGFPGAARLSNGKCPGNVGIDSELSVAVYLVV